MGDGQGSVRLHRNVKVHVAFDARIAERDDVDGTAEGQSCMVERNLSETKRWKAFTRICNLSIFALCRVSFLKFGDSSELYSCPSTNNRWQLDRVFLYY